MKPKHLISIAGYLSFIALLSGCGAAASSIETASASIQQPPAIQRWPSPVENEKGDGSFKAYEYH